MATQTAIVKRPLQELIQASKPMFQGRLPEGMSVERFMYGIVTAVKKNPGLSKCDPQSVMLAAYEAAEVGCDLAPSRQLGWLIPYGELAQFQPSWRFFVQEAYKTGQVSAFYSEVVYAHDHFRREFAPKRILQHVPPNEGDRGEAIGCYALVEFKDGHFDFEYLTKEQIDRHRTASKMPNSLMWKTFWEEGWRKTPIRVLFKRLPLDNPGMEKLAELVEKDAEHDADPVIPGHLEVEEPIAGLPAATAASAEDDSPKRFEDVYGKVPPVTFRVGKMLTYLGGTIKDKFKPNDLKQCGLRIGEDKEWTIPASLTDEFLKLCEKKKVAIQQIDDNGAPIGEPDRFVADDSALPENLWPEEGR